MRHPERSLAALRITVGLWFLKSIFTKLTIALIAGFIPMPVATARWIETMPKLVTRYAAENPIAGYKAFLLGTVVPNEAYAHLTALGEVAIGLALTLGLFTEVGALFGALLVITYGLAVQHMSPAQQGFHVMLFAMMVAFLFARAGRVWGVDGWLARRSEARSFAQSFAKSFRWRTRSHTHATRAGIALILVTGLSVPVSVVRGQRVLVSNEGSGTVSMIERNAVVATIPVGNRPRGIAVAPDGKHAYVALGKDDAVAVIDIATRRTVDRIPVGADPEQVAISPDGRTIYVSNEALDSATAVAVNGHALRFRVAVGREPEGVSVNPNGAKVYVTGESDASVTVLDAVTGKSLSVFHVGARPRFMEFAPSGEWALVTAENGGTVHVIDVRRDTVVATIVIGDTATKPTGIAISPNGRYGYIANGRANQVTIVDVPARAIIGAIPVGQRPWGVALSRDGSTLYVANGRSNNISVVSTAQRRVTQTIAVGERPYTAVVVP
jgi:YVTN family beta-propeller protein